MRDICCLHFEDELLSSIINEPEILFAFGGVESASLAGGGKDMHATRAVW